MPFIDIFCYFALHLQMLMKFLGIIPARFGSSRLEGKPLADINGKPMIRWVYEKACEALETIYVATDDERIYDAVSGFGGRVVMTSRKHTTGTNRCLEALQTINNSETTPFDAVINIQGDEPMMAPEQISTLIKCFEDPETALATLVIPVTDEFDLQNESEVFVTFDSNMQALYFSRSVIPFVHGVPKNEWLQHNTFYKHIGLYAYTAEALTKFASLSTSHLEKVEKLEQNRWMEHGGTIKVGITHHKSIPVDTPEDLERVRKMI
jgi:3-deoxy-manno-octulosonate cytidylyltransferase (CMP-KDO synthetase)